MAEIINGKQIAADINSATNTLACEFERAYGRKVGLAVVRAGDDPASEVYVRNKVRACAACNIASEVYSFPADAKQADIIAKVHALNADPATDGMLVQLPLPAGMDERAVIGEVLPQKDADGFHTVNSGKLFLGESDGIVSCTPRGIMELIRSTGVDITGLNAVVVGRSNIVGKPVASLLLAANATVTVCHSKTVGLSDITKRADILVVAVGKPNAITADMIKPGAVVIDVGINRTEGGLKGDVDFDAAKEVAGYITPVPGGVGPMTVAMLLKNTVEAAYRRMGGSI